MMKTRRIKNEQISSLVTNYLKKRQFTDGPESGDKKEHIQSQDVQEMALAKAVTNESSIANSFVFSSISGDANICHQQYTRLKTFLSEAVEPFKCELLPLLYPLFIHVYLEMLCGGHKSQAHKFYSRYQTLFRNDESHENILNELQQMFNKEDVISCRVVNEFRENKFKYNISEDSFHYLFRYLKFEFQTEESALLLQVLNKHFDFRVGEAESSTDPQQTDEKIASDQMSLVSPPCTPENKVIQNEVCLSSLQQCIKKVRAGLPCLPSICLYNMQNTASTGLCSVDLSRDTSQLLVGHEDSTVALWSLTPDTLSSKASPINVSQIHLSGDYPDNIKHKNNLYSGSEKENVVMQGHSGAVYSTKFTSDDNFALSASEDTSVRLWDLTTHTTRAVYRGHNGPVWSLDTSPVGGYFVTCSHDRTAKLWTTERVYPLRVFIGHTADVDCVRFHANCNYVATGGGDRVVRLWSVHDGQPVRLFQGHKAGIHALAFSHDGKLLASAGEDRRVKVWDLNTGTLCKDLRGHTDTIYSLSFNPHSTVLASGGLDGAIRLWNIEYSSETSSSSETKPNQETTSPELLGCFPVKSTTVHHLHYSINNLLIAIGAS